MILWMIWMNNITHADDPVYGPCPQNNPNCHAQTTSNNNSFVPYTSAATKSASEYCNKIQQKFDKACAWWSCPSTAVNYLNDYDVCQKCIDPADQKTCKDAGWTRKFSCEWLFVDKASARVCNRNRCVADKWYTTTEATSEWMDNACNCKYWVSGVWKTGIPLNTSLPFVGRCVERSSGEAGDDSALNAFPTLVSVATRMLVTVILLVSFIMIVVWGVQWSSGDAKGGKAKITKVIIGIAMLGMMGAILRLINPNFFK